MSRMEDFHFYELLDVPRRYKQWSVQMKTKDLIAEATSLPVEERAIVADLILKSLSAPDAEIDQKWEKIARKRVTEIRSGQVELIPGEEVFRKIQERFQA